jgi:adenosylcobinamide kinase/adenosylcobinamide-phosphate guanylyltransferase
MALQIGQRTEGRKAFIATCPVIDDEMAHRIARHKSERAKLSWETIEEPLNLESALMRTADFQVRVVDCLTLWINNLMYECDWNSQCLDEKVILDQAERVVQMCLELNGAVILVTNEVGMGIVPDNEAARRFRDLAGSCNQMVAEAADQVILMVSGIPIHLRKGDFL